MKNDDVSVIGASGSRRGYSAGRVLGFVIKIAGSLVGLALVFRLVDGKMLAAEIAQMDPKLFGLAVAFSASQIVFGTLRWRSIVAALQDAKGTTPSFGALFRANYIAQLFGQILPFVAGDAMRVLFLANAGAGFRIAFKSVLLDRVFGLLSLFGFVLPWLAISPLMKLTGQLYWWLVAFIVGSLLAAAVALAMANVLARIFGHWRILRILAETLVGMRELIFSRSLWRIIVLCLLVHTGAIATFWTLVKALHLPLGFVDSAAIILISVLSSAVPITVAGWGVRESLVVGLIVMARLPPEGALLLSVSFGSAVLVAALPGGVIWLWTGRPSRASEA